VAIALALFTCGAPYLKTASDQGDYREPATGLLFPSEVCELQRVDVTTYPENALGIGIRYEGNDLTRATFYVYNAGAKLKPWAGGAGLQEVLRHPAAFDNVQQEYDMVPARTEPSYTRLD